MRLTKRSVEALPIPSDGEHFEWDDDLPGFGVRVYPSGRRAYLVQYRMRGRTRRMLLGPHGVLTVDEARRRARTALGRVAEGIDPAAVRDEERQSIRVAELANRYLAEHAEVRKKAASLRNDRLLLRIHILPKLGKLPLEAVSRGDVAALHHALRATPTTANRAAALLSKMFNLAERWASGRTARTRAGISSATASGRGDAFSHARKSLDSARRSTNPSATAPRRKPLRQRFVCSSSRAHVSGRSSRSVGTTSTRRRGASVFPTRRRVQKRSRSAMPRSS